MGRRLKKHKAVQIILMNVRYLERAKTNLSCHCRTGQRDKVLIPFGEIVRGGAAGNTSDKIFSESTRLENYSRCLWFINENKKMK